MAPEVMPTLTFVQGADRMITAARPTAGGLFVRFADEHEGVIPLADLKLRHPLVRVSMPQPYVIELHLANGDVEDVPWDFARHYVDERYRLGSEDAGARGRRILSERLRSIRSERGVTQQELADRAGISRVSVVRIEAGEQLPRYHTLTALSDALVYPWSNYSWGEAKAPPLVPSPYHADGRPSPLPARRPRSAVSPAR